MSTRDDLEFAEGGLDDVRSSSLSLTGALVGLSNRADEAGDDMRSLSRDSSAASRGIVGAAGSAGVASGAFSTLAISTEGLSLSFGSLTTSLTGTVSVLGLAAAAATGLVSTLFPLAAVLGTLTAGATALAGAFGTVLGTGILAFGKQRGEQNKARLEEVRARISALEDLQESEEGLTDAQEQELDKLEELEGKLEDQTGVMGGLRSAFGELRDELVPIIADFGEKFIPLIEDALDAIPALVENTLDAVGGLNQFHGALRQFGGAAMQAIPNVARALMDLAHRALPFLVRAVSWLGRNAGTIFNRMLRVTEQLGPSLLTFARTIINAIPELTDLGTLILKTVVPALTDFVGLVEDVIQFGQQSDGFVDFIKSGLDRLVKWVQGDGRKKLSSVVNSILDTMVALFGDDEQQTAYEALVDFFGDVLVDLSKWFDQGGQQKVTEFLSGFMGAIADAATTQEKQFKDRLFTPFSNILASLFDSITNALSSDEGGRLGAAIGELSVTMIDTVMDSMSSYVASDAFVNDLQQLARAFINSLGKAVKKQLVYMVKHGDLTASDALTSAITKDLTSRIESAGGVQTVTSGTVHPSARDGNNRIVIPGEGKTNGKIVVEGTLTTEDGEIVGKIDERIEDKSRQQAKKERFG